ncbi:PlsC domain-containing protein [Aphelenchoides bicaudatus]|nr:PlsC domain-containing protein [Aphelenchoides bicaudatus]
MIFGLLFTVYIYLLSFLFFTTVLLIAFDLSWGRIPHYYVEILHKIQLMFQKAYPEDYFEKLPWKNIITDKKSILECNDHHDDYEIIDKQIGFPYNTKLNLIRSGVEAIVQDEFSQAFELSPDHKKYRLSLELWNYSDLKLKILFVLMILIRFFVIFPVRLALFVSSFVFITVCCILTYWIEFTTQQKLVISRRFCRLYTAGTGLIAFFHNEELKPKPPGVFVSNHMSANDVMILSLDISPNQDFLYTVTGQQHAGIIGYIQRLVSKLISTMWLERSIADSRLKFLKEVLAAAKNSHLVLMFPEGFCSNNTAVLQFRKAVFEKEIEIYPVAIKQDSRFGDAFWYEDWFVFHLFRVISSYATIYNVHYLPAQRRWEDETAEQFALRIQNQIAKVADCRSLSFQGTLFYKQHDREKYQSHMRKMVAAEVNRISAEAPAGYNMSNSDSP